MGKQWIYLVGLGFVFMGLFAAWELYTTLVGSRNEFSYTLTPIQPVLFEGLDEHFEEDPEYQEYVRIAEEEVEGIEYFRPPAREEI